MIIAKVEIPNMAPDQYDAVRNYVGHLDTAPDGLFVHTTHFSGGVCYNIDAWESEEALFDFGAGQLTAALAVIGLKSTPDIETYQAHEVYVVEPTVEIAPGALTLVCTDIPDTTREQYDEVRRTVDWIYQPEPGGIAHFTWFTADGYCRNFDAWTSQEAFEGFVEGRLMAAMTAVEANVPEINYYPAHEVFAPRRMLYTATGV